nr:MAG: putative RNA polymerase [Eriocheir sinensis blumevirus 2]
MYTRLVNDLLIEQMSSYSCYYTDLKINLIALNKGLNLELSENAIEFLDILPQIITFLKSIDDVLVNTDFELLLCDDAPSRKLSRINSVIHEALIQSFETRINNRVLNPMIALTRLLLRIRPLELSCIKIVRTYLCFLSRLTLITAKQDDILIEKFISTDVRLRGFNHEEEDIACIRNRITRKYKNLDSALKYSSSWMLGASHGPGATNTVPKTGTIIDKYNDLKLPDRLKYQLSLYSVTTKDDIYRRHLASLETEFNSDDISKYGSAHVVFVPKNYKTYRTITTESTGYQFFQQGLRREIYNYIGRNCPEISLTDVTYNRCIVYDSSQKGSRLFSTIDLSEASDSVSVDLVYKLFKDLPTLSSLLRILRPSQIDHELLIGQEAHSPKFGGMGNALTFAVECMIFSAIAEESVARTKKGLEVVDTYNSLTFVHGDDIIVPNYAYRTCHSILRNLGFLPNIEKSFGPDDTFRESCGTEAFLCFDVKPYLFSRGFSTHGLSDQKDPIVTHFQLQALIETGRLTLVHQMSGIYHDKNGYECHYDMCTVKHKKLYNYLISIIPKKYHSESLLNGIWSWEGRKNPFQPKSSIHLNVATCTSVRAYLFEYEKRQHVDATKKLLYGTPFILSYSENLERTCSVLRVRSPRQKR